MYDLEKECDKLVAKLQKICKEKGMSYYALAKRSHISSSTIHSILSGKSRPQVYTLLRICNVLEVTIEDIFSDEEKVSPSLKMGENPTEKMSAYVVSRREKKLLENYRKLSEDKKEWLRICMEALEE